MAGVFDWLGKALLLGIDNSPFHMAALVMTMMVP